MVAVSEEDPLKSVAVQHGQRRAVIDSSAGFWVSWFSLDDLAHTWARRLGELGVRPGDRVAVQEPPGVRFAALLFACLRVGAALVPVSTRGTGQEAARILADCRPRVVIRDGEPTVLPDGEPGPEGDVCVLYTSGTTGPPKGVRLTLANHRASAEGCQVALGTTDRDRWLLMLSPHHVGGLAMFLRGAMCNQAIVTVDAFDPAAVLQAMELHEPTLLSAVPTMLTRLLAAGGAEPLRRLRAILLGGAPATAEQVREWAALGLPVCASYGLTETCSQVATVPPGRMAELAGTAGMPGPHATIEIDPLPGYDGGEGEIVVRGPAVSPGYVNPSISPAPADGAFRTGDVGTLRPDGALMVLGRIDDCIVTGGENVQPDEVEAVLRAHPEVADAAVAGRPDTTWGEVVCAWVESDASEDELDAWCRERLSGFKVPRRWRFVAELPRSEGGKLSRRRLPD